ncbi:MAG: ribonuclease III [Polyangiaceae bacterium]
MNDLAEILGMSLEDDCVVLALTHPSYANEQGKVAHNQRLEFLGDAVLGFCAAELLFARYPEADEGSLTRMRARLVNADSLADWARSHGVPGSLLLGRGAEGGGLRDSTNVLADAVEALIAAVYQTQGLDPARALCERILANGLVDADAPGERDPKSALQERAQALGLGTPNYEVVNVDGPDHARRFEVVVRLGDDALGAGSGRSKRAAEFEAARAALGSDVVKES